MMKPGRKRKVWGILLLAGCLLHCRPPVQVGDPAPDFSVMGLDGHTVQLRDLKGKTVLLHFWATWCPPCVVELPELAGFIRRADPDKVALLAVCVDETGADDIRAFLSAWGLVLPVYLDPGGRLSERFGTHRYPETYVLDPEGFVRNKLVGAAGWKSPAWAHLLQNAPGE